MLSYIQYRMQLFRQAKAELKMELKRPPHTQEAYDSGELDNYYRQAEDLFEWKRLIQTEYLRGKAERLLIPMPDLSDRTMYDQVEWDKDPKQPKYLTDLGLRTVRSAIREEQKHRRESVMFWFGIVFGLIGAVTGLISALKS
ncbi:hypothetical protein ACIQUF_00480 [Pseudomonas sp. NPDC090233]|uniref:hypothetical protein n=1 Tax=Pseudomonas sp. NPDC090233 TaxID=3364479 RepID=UPI00383A9DA2